MGSKNFIKKISDLFKGGGAVTLDDLKKVCMWWLFPGILLTVVIGPHGWARPFYIGQIVVLFNDVAALFIILYAFRSKAWPLILAVTVVLLKTIATIFASTWCSMGYVFLVNVMIFIAAGVIAFQKPDIIYKQVMFICFLSVPLMILQSAGVGGLSQILSSHYYEVARAPDVQSTLFTPLSQIAYDVRVFRPAGLLRSGTLVSLFLLFALPLHFTKTNNRVVGGTAILSAMVALAMGKIVFVGFFIVTVFVLVKGSKDQRSEIGKSAIMLVCFLCLYAFFFPGLFTHNLGLGTIKYSLFVRLNDIADALPQVFGIREAASLALRGTVRSPHPVAEGHASGITVLLMFLPCLMPLIIAGVIFFVKGCRTMGDKFRERIFGCVAILIGMIISLVIFPFWKSVIYWFMMSLALLPMFFPWFQNCLKAEKL
ncbi:MAG: hypothetical protein GY858_02820 [Candidatus Omnitrophica bacterium]|nr:hypothetical protein [Candidatus Omnitrophota bacterium]